MANTYSPENYDAVWDSRVIEIGYDSRGNFRLSAYRNPSPDPGIESPPSIMRVAGGTVYIYDQSGALVRQSPFYSYLDGGGLPGGSTTYATPIFEPNCDYDALGNLDCDGGGGGGGGDEPPPEDPYFIAGGSGSAYVLRGNVLEQTVDLSSPRSAAMMASLHGRAAVRPLKVIKRYKRQPMDVTESDEQKTSRSRWLLESRELLMASAANNSDTSRVITTYQYRAAHVHQAKHRQRQRNLEHTPRPPRTTARTGVETGVTSTDVVANAITCPSEQLRQEGTSATQVMWVHGWMSNESTWCQMRAAVAGSHAIWLDQAYTTDWRAALDAQADALAGNVRIFRTGGTVPEGPTVLVAHSQGGLIARSLAQRYPGVEGVITIATPHLGAVIASHGKDLISQQITNAMLGGCEGGDALCSLINAVGGQLTSGLLTWGIDATLPAASDDALDSDLVLRLNNQSEPFRRSSIQVSVPPRWAIFRIVGDFVTARPATIGPALGGVDWVETAHDIYIKSRVS